jgi:hypothetical protein
MKKFLYILTSLRSGQKDGVAVMGGTHYTTTSYYGSESARPQNHKEGYFFLSIKELEPNDSIKHRDLDEKIRLGVVAPPLR